ncbi:MAG: SpoIIE family protein phosphatase [Mucinivorans sp.]
MFVDISSGSVNCHGERICGDTFMQRYIPNQRRTVAVLSDGMGHGIKANILSTLTASIIVNMGQANEPIRAVADMMVKTLPVCAVRGISYSTFTIIDVNHTTSEVHILEYDNPQTIVLRGGVPMDLQWDSTIIESQQHKRQTLLMCLFKARIGDRIICCSDGVTQSGLGTGHYPFGWGRKNLLDDVVQAVQVNSAISSSELSLHVLRRAMDNDIQRSKDDISCAVVTFRAARRLLLCSCPPVIASDANHVAQRVTQYPGQSIICGYLLATMVAKSLGREIRRNLTSTDPELPPLWFIEGVDLVTEGLLTLSKVVDILDSYDECPTGRGPAYRIVRMVMASDEIEMIIGMKEQGDPLGDIADNYVLRRKLLEKIARLMEVKYHKRIIKIYQ